MGKRKLMTRVCKHCGAEFVTKSKRQYCFACRTYRASGPMAKPTLCWDCKKSTAGDNCPWANEFIPVEGWDATETILVIRSTRDYEREDISYTVHSCPLFERG